MRGSDVTSHEEFDMKNFQSDAVLVITTLVVIIISVTVKKDST